MLARFFMAQLFYGDLKPDIHFSLGFTRPDLK